MKLWTGFNNINSDSKEICVTGTAKTGLQKLKPINDSTTLSSAMMGGFKRPHKLQSGVVLVVSLIMLLLLTLIALSGSQSTSLEEKMAGNMRDRNLAFQAAEAALRDAESDINNVRGNALKRISGVTDFTSSCGAANGFSTAADSDDGLCYAYPGSFAGSNSNPPTWPTEALMSAPPSVSYGTFTGAAAITGIPAAQQPRYIIEGLNGMGRECNFLIHKPCYRVTVRAQGANPNTVVWLQTIYIPS
jgi:type IV pilus assembly protein PilX